MRTTSQPRSLPQACQPVRFTFRRACLAAVLCLALCPANRPAAASAYQDRTDALDILFRRPLNEEISSAAPREHVTFVPGPYLSVNPTSGTIMGMGTNALFRLGDPASTLLSTIDNVAAYSTQRHFIFFSKSTVLTWDNVWELQGDWRYYRFSQPLGNLGTSNPEAFTDARPGVQILACSQSLTFDYLRIHQTAFRRLAGPIYVGLGYRLDDHLHVSDSGFDPAAGEQTLTSHAAYSVAHGFDPTRYATSGVSANLLLDSRDHVLNPYQGQYLLLSYTCNATQLGSSQDSQVAYGEYRHYLPLSEKCPRHTLGFWAIATAVTRGKLPYLDLPAEGNDVRERSGRGYSQGTWRGDKLAYAEVEYRFPILANGLLGGVAFVNAVTTGRPPSSNPSLGIQDPGCGWFESVKPAAGAGLRLMVVKSIRMNIEVDFAQGVNDTGKLYLNVFEIF